MGRDTLAHVGGERVEIDRRKGRVEAGEDRVLDIPCLAGGGAIDHQRLQPLDHHRAAELHRRGPAIDLGDRRQVHAESIERLRSGLRLGAAAEDRDLEAGLQHRRHHRSFEIVGTACGHGLRGPLLGRGGSRVDIDEDLAGLQPFGRFDRYRLGPIGSDGREDEGRAYAGFLRRSSTSDAELLRCGFQTAPGLAAEEQVIDADGDALIRQQPARKGLADLAEADEGDRRRVGACHCWLLLAFRPARRFGQSHSAIK
jgi:hypothetical protein